MCLGMKWNFLNVCEFLTKKINFLKFAKADPQLVWFDKIK